MKATKFLPLVLAAMLVSPAVFADATPNASSQMTLTNPEFINITVTETVKSSGATFDDAYSTITLSTPFDVTFNVVNNKKDRPIYLSAKAVGSDGTGEALGGEATAPVLAFANETFKPTKANILNAVGGAEASIELNPNVIAFALTPAISPSEAASAQPSASIANNVITYTLSNGKYAFNYVASTNQAPNTFSTHDQNGTYKTTLTLSSTNP